MKTSLINRRGFLSRTTPLLLAGGSTAFLPGCAVQGQTALGNTFSHGVASGDPLSDRVILWTRISAQQSPSVSVSWRIAKDENMRNVVNSGVSRALASQDYTVKIDALGLAENTYYYYQFESAGDQSPVGRTRTLPSSGTPDIRLAVASCANYPYGHFNVYRRIAQREDINAVVHLGDYFYEYAPGTYDWEGALARDHFPDREVISLLDYRGRHAQYKTDPDLQEAHRLHPWICVWDDHESTNNSWFGGAQNHNEDEGDWWVRRTMAIKAYHEWMPIREQSMAVAGTYIYRNFRFGDTADLVMLDTRLHGRSEQVDKADVEKINDPSRTLLGRDQLAWLQQQLTHSKNRGANWRLLGQQCMFGQLLDEKRNVLNADQWDGYAHERAVILDQLKSEKIDNTVILTGDIHSAWGLDICEDPFGSGYNSQTGEGSLAVELICSSVTSPSPFGDEEEALSVEKRMVAEQPHIHWVNFRQRGYVVVDLNPERASAQWWLVDTVAKVQHQEHLAATMITELGANHLVAD